MSVKWGPIRTLTAEEMDAEYAEAARQYAEHVAETCACKLAGAMPYLLEIEENRVTGLKCTGCGHSVMAEWIEDALSTRTDLPVTVKWEYSAPDYWGEDPGYTYGEISPRQDGGTS